METMHRLVIVTQTNCDDADTSVIKSEEESTMTPTHCQSLTRNLIGFQSSPFFMGVDKVCNIPRLM